MGKPLLWFSSDRGYYITTTSGIAGPIEQKYKNFSGLGSGTGINAKTISSKRQREVPFVNTNSIIRRS